jgi:hypothetical protein
MPRRRYCFVDWPLLKSSPGDAPKSAIRSWNWCKIALTRACSRSGGCGRPSARAPIPHQVDPELKTRLQTEGEDTLRTSKTATVGASQMLFYR